MPHKTPTPPVSSRSGSSAVSPKVTMLKGGKSKNSSRLTLQVPPFLSQKSSSASLSSADLSRPTSAQEEPSSAVSHTRQSPINILVVGGSGVGKSALVVKFLTRRFLPEYAGGDNKTYERQIAFEDSVLTLKITELSAERLERELEREDEDLLSHQDALVVVYSLTNQESWSQALDLLQAVKFSSSRARTDLPTAVVGNKQDLCHSRLVNEQVAGKQVLKYPGCFHEETSAAEETDQIHRIFHLLLRQILSKQETRTIKNSSGRKVSISSIGSPNVIRKIRKFSITVMADLKFGKRKEHEQKKRAETIGEV